MRIRQPGFGLLGLLGLVLSIPFILIGIAILGFISTLIYQAYWDGRVEEMCEKDGGRTIYERVVLSEEAYGGMLDSMGNLRIPIARNVKDADMFVYEYKRERVFSGILGLKVTKYFTRIIRREDRKLVAEQISYGRQKGDFPFSSANGSSFSCPKFERGWYSEIFLKN